jgi:hypothetical protein
MKGARPEVIPPTPTPTLDRIRLACSAASQVDDLDVKRMHDAAARSLFDRSRRELSEVEIVLKALEAELVRVGSTQLEIGVTK